MQTLHGPVYYCQGLLRLHVVFGMENLNLEGHIPLAYHEPFLCLLLPVHRDLGLEGELTEVQPTIRQ